MLFTEAERLGQAGIDGESDLRLEHSHSESQLVSQVCGLGINPCDPQVAGN